MDKIELQLLRSSLLQIAKGLELTRSGIIALAAQIEREQHSLIIKKEGDKNDERSPVGSNPKA